MASSLGEEPHRSDPSDGKQEQQVYKVKNSRPKVQSPREKELDKRPKSWKMIPFNEMLPKGWFPRSGSSPCHNDTPDSLEFFECGRPRRRP
ncbi:hypothetical protein AMTRI_Chr13g92630 [Amborella trichopoda]